VSGNDWKIIILPIAEKQLAAIKDTRIREGISKRIDGLRRDPDKQGKPMIDELMEYRSLRAVGQRYRILYKVTHETVVVSIVALGIRKEGDKADVYALAKKLIRLGLLGQE
jgi:mRNA interferase RelE/StbE